jgi:RHS repeat-associated protein
VELREFGIEMTLPHGSRRHVSGRHDSSDGESGLVYMNARYYDPEIGRFLSPDTIVPDALNPQSLNRYSYVANNPLSNVDPTGHELGSVFMFVYTVIRIATSIPRHHPKHLSREASVGGGSVRSPEVAAQGGHMLGFQSGYGKYWSSSVFGARAASGVSEASPLHDIVRTTVIWALQRGAIRAAGDRTTGTWRSEDAAVERASGDQDAVGASPIRVAQQLEPETPDLVNPTGGRIRGRDAHGSGEYGADRVRPGGRIVSHPGVDVVGEPGADVRAPVTGTLEVLDSEGVRITTRVSARGGQFSVILRHLNPNRALNGRHVGAGSTIGTVADLPQPGMTDHVHLELYRVRPTPQRLDPTPHLPVPR